MTKLRLNKILDLMTETLYLGVVFLLPIFFAIFFKTANVFELNKIVLFRILVLLLFLSCFSKLVFSGAIMENIKLFFRIKGKYLIAPFLYIFSLSILTLFSRFPENSFWGLYQRQMGLYTYIFIFIFFFLLLFSVNSKAQTKRILVASSFSVFLVCAYGLMQAFGFDFFDWIEPVRGRVISSFGQPNFLASYLLLFIPISIYSFQENQNKKKKIFYVVLFLMELACLFFTNSRGGLVALVLGGLIFFSFGLLFTKREKLNFVFKNKIYIAIIIFGLFVFALFWFSLAPAYKVRIESSFDSKQASVASRVSYWRSGWDAIKKRPWLGYGLENQQEIYSRYYQRDWGVYDKVNTIPDRAHNLFIDSLLTGGIFGLLLLILWNSYFLYFIFFNLKNNNFKNLSLAILFAYICYTISLLFSFSVFVTELYFWLFLLILSFTRIYQENTKDLDFFVQKNNKNKFYIIPQIIFFFLVAGLVIFRASCEVKVLIADQYFREIQISIANQEYFKTFVLLDYLKEEKIPDNYYLKNYGLLLSSVYGSFYEETLIRPGKTILLEVLKVLNANSFYDNLNRARIYAVLGNEKNEEYFKQSEDLYSKELSLSPQLPVIYKEMATMYLKKKDYTDSIKFLDDFITKLPDINDPSLNYLHRSEISNEISSAYLLYGDIAFSQKNIKEAERYYLLAQAMETIGFNSHIKLASFYSHTSNQDKYIEESKKLTILDKANYYWSFVLAKIFFDQGDYKQAKYFSDKAILLAPESDRVIKLQKDINNKILSKS